MRRFNIAVSCSFACLVFFSGVAPGNYNADPNIALDISIVPPAEAETAPVAKITEPGEPEELGADLPANDPSNLKKPTSLERARAALAESSTAALSDQELCTTLVEVARSNDLPLGFFTNLIWRESRFDHAAISRVGAMGIAQFMPDVAEALRLDAFDAREALPASGRLLRALRARFANLGLIAAAYNAGPKRVLDWLAARASLPTETRDYVKLITGRSVEEWRNAKARTAVFDVPRQVPCHQVSTFSSVERAERAAQEQKLAEEKRAAQAAKLAEEKRIAALSARKASLHQRQAGARLSAISKSTRKCITIPRKTWSLPS